MSHNPTWHFNKGQNRNKIGKQAKHSKSIHNKLISYPPPQLHHQKYNRNTRNIIVTIKCSILLCKHHSIATTFKKRRENMFHHASTLCHLTWRQVLPAPVERNWRHFPRVTSQLGDLLLRAHVPYPHGVVVRACEEEEGGTSTAAKYKPKYTSTK